MDGNAGPAEAGPAGGRPAGPPAGRGRWPDALAGVLATGLGLGLAHLAGALVAPVSSPVLAVADRVIDLTPGPLKEWAIATFGTGDKTVLVTGVIVVTLGLGAVVGLASRRRLALGIATGGLLALIALLAASAEPGRPGAWPVPALVAVAAGAAALALLRRAAEPRARTDGSVGRAESAASRRRFLRLGATLGGAGLLAGLVGDRLSAAGGVRSVTGGGTPPVLPSRSATAFPTGLEGQAQGMAAFITPASDFYRIDTALLVPSLDPATWTLSIDGMVDHPFSIGWDELLRLDAVERAVTLECVSNDVGGTLIGSARWVGARTSELLARAGVQGGADQVLSTSADGFTVSTPLQALLDGRDALVVYEMNGAPLPAEHGFPVRLLTPGLYGFVGATKWLVRMTVTTYRAAPAYWTERGWSQTGPIKPGSRIEMPRDGSVPAGAVKVGGTAWAHGVGVGRVQVRVDRGPWQDATLGPDAGIEYWRQWLWTWNAVRGQHELQARVIDAHGVAQDEAIVSPFPDGATGLHTVQVTVS